MNARTLEAGGARAEAEGAVFLGGILTMTEGSLLEKFREQKCFLTANEMRGK